MKPSKEPANDAEEGSPGCKPDAKVKDLGVGKQQLVEIAKALSRNVAC
jgi:ABC-type sugar transport system ATPase subunit